jgi:DNA invertase Pin-like site-specific DNA recombinase
MNYGYIRVSTLCQARDGNSLEAQMKMLTDAGAEKIYSDIYTGAKIKRDELDKLLNILQPKDKLIITKFDRIARSTVQGSQLISTLLERDITVEILNMGQIDNTPTGRLIIHIMLAFAEFERDMILERTQEGKAIARQKAGYREGRPKKYSREQINHALELMETHTVPKVSEMLNISRSTLMRAKRKQKSNDGQ